MEKRSPWRQYADGHAASFEAEGKEYFVIVTDAYINTRYRLRDDHIVDRHSLLEEIEDDIRLLAAQKMQRGLVLHPVGKRPPEIIFDASDAQSG